MTTEIGELVTTTNALLDAIREFDPVTVAQDVTELEMQTEQLETETASLQAADVNQAGLISQLEAMDTTFTSELAGLDQRVDTLESVDAWKSGIVGIDPSVFDLTGTGAETTLFSRTLPGGVLQPGDEVYLFAMGTITGTGGTKRFRAYLDNTLLYTETTATSTQNPWRFHVWLVVQTSTQAVVRVEVFTRTNRIRHDIDLVTVDLSQPLTLSISGDLGNANDHIIRQVAKVEATRLPVI